MERLFSDEELAYLPIGFQFFEKPNETIKSKPEFQEKEKICKIDYYKTDKYRLYSHYKPVGKVIKTKNNG